MIGSRAQASQPEAGPADQWAAPSSASMECDARGRGIDDQLLPIHDLQSREIDRAPEPQWKRSRRQGQSALEIASGSTITTGSADTTCPARRCGRSASQYPRPPPSAPAACRHCSQTRTSSLGGSIPSNRNVHRANNGLSGSRPRRRFTGNGYSAGCRAACKTGAGVRNTCAPCSVVLFKYASAQKGLGPRIHRYTCFGTQSSRECGLVQR